MREINRSIFRNSLIGIREYAEPRQAVKAVIINPQTANETKTSPRVMSKPFSARGDILCPFGRTASPERPAVLLRSGRVV